MGKDLLGKHHGKMMELDIVAGSARIIQEITVLLQINRLMTPMIAILIIYWIK